MTDEAMNVVKYCNIIVCVLQKQSLASEEGFGSLLAFLTIKEKSSKEGHSALSLSI